MNRRTFLKRVGQVVAAASGLPLLAAVPGPKPKIIKWRRWANLSTEPLVEGEVPPAGKIHTKFESGAGRPEWWNEEAYQREIAIYRPFPRIYNFEQ